MAKKKAKRLTPEEQSNRFREAAKEAGLEKGKQTFDDVMKKVGKLKYATYTKAK